MGIGLDKERVRGGQKSLALYSGTEACKQVSQQLNFRAGEERFAARADGRADGKPFVLPDLGKLGEIEPVTRTNIEHVCCKHEPDSYVWIFGFCCSNVEALKYGRTLNQTPLSMYSGMNN